MTTFKVKKDFDIFVSSADGKEPQKQTIKAGTEINVYPKDENVSLSSADQKNCMHLSTFSKLPAIKGGKNGKLVLEPGDRIVKAAEAAPAAPAAATPPETK